MDGARKAIRGGPRELLLAYGNQIRRQPRSDKSPAYASSDFASPSRLLTRLRPPHLWGHPGVEGAVLILAGASPGEAGSIRWDCLFQFTTCAFTPLPAFASPAFAEEACEQKIFIHALGGRWRSVFYSRGVSVSTHSHANHLESDSRAAREGMRVESRPLLAEIWGIVGGRVEKWGGSLGLFMRTCCCWWGPGWVLFPPLGLILGGEIKRQTPPQ